MKEESLNAAYARYQRSLDRSLLMWFWKKENFPIECIRIRKTCRVRQEMARFATHFALSTHVLLREALSLSLARISLYQLPLITFHFTCRFSFRLHLLWYARTRASRLGAILLDSVLPFTRYPVNSRRLTPADLPTSSILVLTICRELQHESDCETWSSPPASLGKLCRHDCNRIRNAVRSYTADQLD